VHDGVLQRLTSAFSALRHEHELGTLNYPYSAREAVAVVKHVQKYPKDGALAAIENILQFENLAPAVRAHVASVFQASGIPVPSVASTGNTRPGVKLAPILSSPPPTIGTYRTYEDTQIAAEITNIRLQVCVCHVRVCNAPHTTYTLMPLLLSPNTHVHLGSSLAKRILN